MLPVGRFDLGSVSFSRGEMHSRITAKILNTTKTPRHENLSDTNPPKIGAHAGAKPLIAPMTAMHFARARPP